MIQNRVMPPGIASLREKDSAAVQDVMKSLVVTAVGTGGRKTVCSCVQEKLGKAGSQCKSEGQRTLYLVAESREKISSQSQMLPSEGV